MEKRKVSLEQCMPYKDVVEYLRGFMAGFEKGAILVEKDGECLSLVPTDNVAVEIEAKMKGNKQSFSLEVSWETPISAESSAFAVAPMGECPSCATADAASVPDEPADTPPDAEN